jgi:hypothetical protein
VPNKSPIAAPTAMPERALVVLSLDSGLSDMIFTSSYNRLTQTEIATQPAQQR